MVPRIACSESMLDDDLLGVWELAARARVCGIEVVDSPQGLPRRLDALKRAQRSGVVLSTVCMQPPFLGQYDPATIQLGCARRSLRCRPPHVHVADSNRLQPGAGHLDIPTLVGVLGRSGYDGWLTLECEVRGPRESALRQAVHLLTAAWAESWRSTPPTSPHPATAAGELG